MPAEQIGRWTSVDNTDFAQDGGRDAALALACSLHARNEVPCAATAFCSSCSRSMRITLAGAGCWPRFLPVRMTRREAGDLAQRKVLIVAQPECGGDESHP